MNLTYWYDWTYLLLIPAFLVTLLAQLRVKKAYAKYAAVRTRGGETGARTARRLLDAAGLTDIAIERVPGEMTDHYDPKARVLRLSPGVADGATIAALGVAAHETGHALQDAEGYAPLAVRSLLVPAANIGTRAAWPLFLLGLIASWDPLMVIGIAVYALAVAFTLIALPVEMNASRRALAALENGGYLEADELAGAKDVLSAAALTYVAAALTAILQLIRLIALRGRRRD